MPGALCFSDPVFTMKKIAVLAAALVVMGAAQAQSKSPLYGELGYTFTKVSSDGVDFNPGVLRGMLGYEVNPYLALEAMYGTSLSDDSTSIDGVTVKAEVLPAPENLAAMIRKTAEAGDYVICLGAGSISAWANALPEELAKLD